MELISEEKKLCTYGIGRHEAKYFHGKQAKIYCFIVFIDSGYNFGCKVVLKKKLSKQVAVCNDHISKSQARHQHVRYLVHIFLWKYCEETSWQTKPSESERV